MRAFSRETGLAILAVAAVAAAGCHHVGDPEGGDDDWDDDGPSSDGDSDGDADADADADADSDTDTDADPIDDWIGMPCQDGEGGNDYCVQISGSLTAFCFAWEGAPGGICTRECMAATYETPVDGCDMDGVVCMDISHLTEDSADDEDGYGLCVEKCVPKTIGMPCKADTIACDPRAWSFEAQFATCLLPKCQDDSDCLVDSGPACDGDGDCLTESGEFCAGNQCVFEGTCDTASGLCSWTGDPSAEIGDPCASSWDCPDNSLCFLPDTDAYGKTIYANGTCARSGCKAANTSATNESGSPDPAIIARYGCGMLGTCHAGFPFGGLCHRRCDPSHQQAAFRCRQPVWDGDVLDESGDYDCYDQSLFGYPIFAEGNALLYTVAPHPFCAPVGSEYGAKCGSGDDQMTPADCATYFANNNNWQLGMACRDPATGETDSEGYCLDNTTSGPTGTW